MGGALGGGLFMLGFGIGTLPVLATAGILAGLATRIRRFRYLNTRDTVLYRLKKYELTDYAASS